MTKEQFEKAINCLVQIPEFKKELEDFRFSISEKVYLRRIDGGTHYSGATVAVCNEGRKEIAFSSKHLRFSQWEEVIETLCHEIAHIGTSGHGPSWRSKFNLLLSLVPESLKYEEPNDERR